MADVLVLLTLSAYLLAGPNAGRAALAAYGVLWFLNRR